MYYLYAEDTKSKAAMMIMHLASNRFSRAMKQARKEPPMYGCRYFVGPFKLEPDTHREYLDTRSVEQVNRATLQSQVAVGAKVLFP